MEAVNPKSPLAHGWRRDRGDPALSDVHGTISVPKRPGLGRLIAFLGPGYLVAVGYMDPGNWATSLAGGSQFGYALLTVALLSNLLRYAGYLQYYYIVFNVPPRSGPEPGYARIFGVFRRSASGADAAATTDPSRARPRARRS